MALDILPYLIASDAVGAGATTLVMTVGDGGGWPVLPGDVVIIAGGTGAAQPTGITDTQGHTYTKISGSATSPAVTLWKTVANNGLKAAGPGVTADQITITYTGTGQAKQWIAVGMQSMALPEDVAVTIQGTGTSAAPSLTSGVPSQAGEMFVAIVTTQNAAGTFTWDSGWQVVASNITSGVNASASMATRLGTAAAAVTASGTTAASAAWNVIIVGIKPAVVSNKGIVGASIFSGAYPGLGYTNYQAKTAFDGFVSRVSANRGCKRYLNENEYESAANPAQSVVDYMVNHDIFCVVCVKPTRAVGGGVSSSLTSLRTMITYWKNNGIAPHVCMGNESNINGQHGPFGDGTSKTWTDASGTSIPSPYGTPTGAQAAQNYIDWFNYHGPTITSSGLQCQYNPAISSSSSALTFIPPRLQSDGRPLCTGISIDYYYSGDYAVNGITLASILSSCNSTSPPFPAGIGEMGGTDGSTRPIQDDPAGTASWIDNQVRIPMTNQLTAGAQANLPVMWYANGTGNTIDGTTDSRVVAAYQRLFDALDPSVGGGPTTWMAFATSSTVSVASGHFITVFTLSSALVDSSAASGTLYPPGSTLLPPSAPPPPLAMPMPSPYPLRAPGNVYRFVTTDTVTGRVLADSLPITGLTAQSQINSVGSFSGNLTLPTAGPGSRMVATWMKAVQPWRSILWVFQNGFPIWNGPIVAWNHQSVSDGTLPLQAASMEEFFKHRQVDTNLVFNNLDIFEIFRQELLFALSKTPNGNIAGTGRYANQSGIVDVVQYSGIVGSVVEADSLKKVYDCWNDLVTTYGLEYTLAPAITSAGSLFTQVRLGLPLLGRKFVDTQFQITFPSRGLIDYAFPWTPQSAVNREVVTGSGSGSNPVNYQVASTGVVDGMPLLEDSQSFSGTVTSQAQIQKYSDSLVVDFAPSAFINPTFLVGDDAVPQVRHVQLGDEVRTGLTSPLHPSGPQGRPGYMGAFRLTGWTLNFPAGSQPEQTMYTLGAGTAPTLQGG